MTISPSSHPAYAGGFTVYWTQGGKKRQRHFKSKAAAKSFSATIRPELDGWAKNDRLPDADERRALAEARKNNVPLLDAIRLWSSTVGKSARLTVGELVAARKLALPAAISEAHRRNTETILKKLEPLHGRIAAEISAADLMPIILAGKSRSTQIKIKAIFSAVWQHAISMGWLAANPAKAIKATAARNLEAPKIMTPRMARRWLEVLATRGPGLFNGWAIALFAGLRWSEIRRITWGEIDLAGEQIFISPKNAKTRNARRVSIQPNLAAMLAAVPESKRRGRIFIPSLRVLAACEKLAGFEVHKNVARHSFVTFHYAKFGDVAKTEMESGHDRKILFANYRTLVKPEAAKEYFEIEVSRADRLTSE